MDTGDSESSQNFQKFSQESNNLNSVSNLKSVKSFSQKPDSNTKTFFALVEKADKGSADAQFQVGRFYEDGKNVLQSYKSAFHYYKLAADQSHSKAQTSLARLFEGGLGVTQDFEQAFHYYKLASTQENLAAIAKLGKFYEEGKGGVEKSSQEAIRYYQMAIGLGSTVAWRYLAEAYEKGIGGENSEDKARFCRRKGFLLTKEEADKGDPCAQTRLGSMFEDGEGVEQSIESAVHYYEMSAKQNHVIGLLCLGDCYKNGKGVQKSSTKALYYYKLAMDQGDPDAPAYMAQCLLENNINEQAVYYLKLVVQRGQCDTRLLTSCEYQLGLCFEEGREVKKSDQDALYYYLMASDHGDSSAQKRLGDAFLNGELGLKRSPEKSIEYYQLAGDQGCSFSLQMIGQCYEKGEGVKQSAEKAFYYYNKGAEIDLKDGYCSSFYELGRCYELGIGAEKSLENAAYYYKLAAENDSTICYFKVGCCYNEMGGEQNVKKAAAYFKMAITEVDPLNPVAQLNLAEIFEAGLGIEKSVEEALNYYRLYADQGDSTAQYFMGNLYKWGKGVEQSNAESLKFYKLSADQEYGPALIQLAYYYDSEKVKNYKKACEYYKKAADQGYAEAQSNLGFHYDYGNGVDKNTSKAIHYYKLAAEKNNKEALYNLALCYKNGLGVTQSSEEAFKYFKKAADQEYGPALIKLGDFYDSDEVKDYKKSCEYYKKAADKGYAEAQCNLGVNYKTGKGVDIDLSKAIHYYQLAAEQNNTAALYNLANCYEDGLVDDMGVVKSSIEAFKYFKKAADQGFARAQFSVALRYSLGLGVKKSLEEAIKYYELALAQDYRKERTLELIQQCKARNAYQTEREKLSRLIDAGTSELEKRKGVISQLSDQKAKIELSSILANLLAQSEKLNIRAKIKNDDLGMECDDLRKLNADMIEHSKACQEFLAALNKILCAKKDMMKTSPKIKELCKDIIKNETLYSKITKRPLRICSCRIIKH